MFSYNCKITILSKPHITPVSIGNVVRLTQVNEVMCHRKATDSQRGHGRIDTERNSIARLGEEKCFPLVQLFLSC